MFLFLMILQLEMRQLSGLEPLSENEVKLEVNVSFIQMLALEQMGLAIDLLMMEGVWLK